MECMGVTWYYTLYFSEVYFVEYILFLIIGLCAILPVFEF